MAHYTSRVEDWSPMWSAPKSAVPPTMLFPSSASAGEKHTDVKSPVHMKPLMSSKASSATVQEFTEWIRVDTNVMVFVCMILIFILILVCGYLNSKINDCKLWQVVFQGKYDMLTMCNRAQ